MQATEDGEFFSEKKLNFKIPRKRANSTTDESSIHHNQSALANLYYNYPYQSTGSYQFYPDSYGNVPGQGYGNSVVYNGQVQVPSSSGYTHPTPPGVDDTALKIFDTLTEIKEKPKTYRENIFQQTVPDLLDDSLPKELKAQFQPLFCKLCAIKLSSNQTAKTHYKSKNHEKKVRKWLVDWSATTGAPLPARALPSPSAKKDKSAEQNPAWFHCDLCDLDLTGQLHAESHYMGKNHQKAMLGHKAPAGSGYFNAEGKWVRTKGQKSKNYDFEQGEDNFGAAFKTPKPVTESTTSPEPIIGPVPLSIFPAPSEPPAKKKKVEVVGQFHCDICKINATNQEQLNTHYKGKNHAKKLKSLGMDAYTVLRMSTEAATSLSIPPPPVEPEPYIDLAVHRTPSGDYYCASCNSTSNSELQFMQHMKSKNHMKKASQQK
ncbi:unnamed protein product [Ceutorhynchus assimilis]|uniref:Zinc finger matrin-type protein 3 n=1 Tax=Ceutorhynchus assimilis TaxID=467358 RepID=A0A9N9MWA9_9CUCU|nr:unnamed protein product [Ceutorhynchus assimilis]